MLQVWKKTGDRRYFDYVEAWADSLVDDKGEIHLYKKETYNLVISIPEKFCLFVQ